MLKVEDINVYYGAIHAIKGISLEVNDGEIVALIGSNGAGKSTTLRTISGLMKPKTGRIMYDGEDITGDRLLYEIIPLLEEYVQDGVLSEEANDTIERLYQKAVE